MTRLLLILSLALVGCTGLQTTPTVEPAPIEQERAALPWKHADWDQALRAAIEANWTKLAPAKDMPDFCPKYSQLSDAGKKEAWAHLFVAIAKPESSWDPATRYFEKTMGYYSEGLYQLSVVDESWAKCGLAKDTILKPDVNIRCAVKIMAGQVSKQGVVKASKGFYWAVIIPNGKHQKIAEITASARKAPGCL